MKITLITFSIKPRTSCQGQNIVVEISNYRNCSISLTNTNMMHIYDLIKKLIQNTVCAWIDIKIAINIYHRNYFA